MIVTGIDGDIAETVLNITLSHKGCMTELSHKRNYSIDGVIRDLTILRRNVKIDRIFFRVREIMDQAEMTLNFLRNHAERRYN